MQREFFFSYLTVTELSSIQNTEFSYGYQHSILFPSRKAFKLIKVNIGISVFNIVNESHGKISCHWNYFNGWVFFHTRLRILFTLPLTERSLPVGCRAFYRRLEIGNMDIYCNYGPTNFKEAISGSWLKNDLILLQVYCQHNAVLALQDAWCGSFFLHRLQGHDLQ